MSFDNIVFVLLLCVVGTLAVDVGTTPSPESDVDLAELHNSQNEELQTKLKIVKRVKDTIKSVKQLQSGTIEKAVQTNFLQTLYTMANASAVTGSDVSRASATLIRGYVQDSFNLVSLTAYFPRLIFLDGPTQFIETLRLIRANQIRIPNDMNSAIDTLINFASQARESQITMNIGTPFFSFFPNVFRGAELLSTNLLYSVFQWFAPLTEPEVSGPAIEGLWNRWDTKSSTTSKYDYDKRWKQ
ncbi:hypothetical protein Ocin01_08311 [Orchesella cincta]|uniref:Uncharacterized protein n=1 Tax=Orchesella cincta TaxID=48709 RepID=A0A1D2MZB2_ORCCI|nr:hypothetical protein Ocin01_08311 [Orchesella cincta]